GRPRSFAIHASATPLQGPSLESRTSGKVGGYQRTTVRLPLQPALYGYHGLTIELMDASATVLLRRKTSFAWLPEDTRAHREQSPFGTWEWNGTHVTSTDSDRIGSLYKKLGF